MAEQNFHLVRGKESAQIRLAMLLDVMLGVELNLPSRACLPPMTKAHVIRASTDEMGHVVFLCPAKLHETKRVEILGVLPHFRVPHVDNVNPDIVPLAQTQAVAQCDVVDSNTTKVGC